MSKTLQIAFNQLIKFLERIEKEEKIKYYLVGGILSNIYTVFRATQDIDFVIDLQSCNLSIEYYISLLQENHFLPPQDWTTTAILARDSKIIQFFDKQDTVKFDNYLIDKFDMSKYKRIGPIALKNRVREKLFDIECWVTSKEDFIISKLVYGGWQDYADALGCWIRFVNKLNIKYLEKKSHELKIQRELELLKSGIDDPDEFFNNMNQ